MTGIRTSKTARATNKPHVQLEILHKSRKQQIVHSSAPPSSPVVQIYSVSCTKHYYYTPATAPPFAGPAAFCLIPWLHNHDIGNGRQSGVIENLLNYFPGAIYFAGLIHKVQVIETRPATTFQMCSKSFRA